MYNIKYRLEYTSRGNYTTVIDILKKDYVGGIIELIGSSNPFEIVYENSNSINPYSTFQNSLCVLEIKESQQLVNDFKEIVDEDNYILKYKRNGVLHWSGYILAEQFTSNDDPNNPFIQLKFYDAISRLRVYTINDLSLNQESLTYSLVEIFDAVNNLLYNNINSNSSILFNNYLVNTVNLNSNLLDVIYIQRSVFFDNDLNEFNLYDILEKIAVSFSFTYLLYKDRLMISNFQYSANPQFIDFENGKSLMNLSNVVNIDANHYWLNKSKFTTHYDALKKIEVYHTFDNDPNYLNNIFLNQIWRLREYTNDTIPTVSSEAITFFTFADVDVGRGSTIATRSYKDVFVKNELPVSITNSSVEPADRRYKLTLNFRLEFDYGITDVEYFALNRTERLELENDIKEVEENTEVRGYITILNVNNGTNFYLTSGRGGTTRTFQTVEDDFEMNELRDLQVSGFNDLISGKNLEVDFIVNEGVNQLYFSFYHPYVYTRVDRLSSSNDVRIEGVKYIISDLALVEVGKIGIEEFRFEGSTDRNIFNYNLNRDFPFYFLNIEERNYKYSLLQSNGLTLLPNSFIRKNRNYINNKSESLDIHSLLINQYLEQFELQQEYVTGELKVYNDSNFSIVSVINMDGKDFKIIRYSLSDKAGEYSIDLMEIK